MYCFLLPGSESWWESNRSAFIHCSGIIASFSKGLYWTLSNWTKGSCTHVRFYFSNYGLQVFITLIKLISGPFWMSYCESLLHSHMPILTYFKLLYSLYMTLAHPQPNLSPIFIDMNSDMICIWGCTDLDTHETGFSRTSFTASLWWRGSSGLTRFPGFYAATTRSFVAWPIPTAAKYICAGGYRYPWLTTVKNTHTDRFWMLPN